MGRENLFHVSLIGGYNKQDVSARIQALEREIASQKELHKEEKAGLQRQIDEKEREAQEKERELEERTKEKEETLEEQKIAWEKEMQEQHTALEEQKRLLEAEAEEQRKELEARVETLEAQKELLEAEVKEQKEARQELEEKLAQMEKEYKRLDRKFQEASASAEVIKGAFGTQVTGLVQRITEFSDDYKKTQIDFLELYRYVLAMGERILTKEEVEKSGTACFDSWDTAAVSEFDMEYVKMKPAEY